MKDRISTIISDAKVTKAEFAKRIEVSQPFVSQMCSGSAKPSTRTITNICREFHIRREWLEAGEGPMKLPEVDHNMEVISRLLEGDEDPVARFVLKFMEGYYELTPENQKVIQELLRKAAEQK